jgi:hypothetical protein
VEELEVVLHLVVDMEVEELEVTELQVMVQVHFKVVH